MSNTASPSPAAPVAQHTPTPWAVMDHDGKPALVIQDSPGGSICGICAVWDTANAELIVSAVNSHAVLVARVAALESALAMMIDMADAKVSPSWEKVKQARAALAKARGTEGGK